MAIQFDEPASDPLNLGVPALPPFLAGFLVGRRGVGGLVLGSSVIAAAIVTIVIAITTMIIISIVVFEIASGLGLEGLGGLGLRLGLGRITTATLCIT